MFLILGLVLIVGIFFLFNTTGYGYQYESRNKPLFMTKKQKIKWDRDTEEINTRFGGDYSAWKKRNNPY